MGIFDRRCLLILSSAVTLACVYTFLVEGQLVKETSVPLTGCSPL